MEKVKVEPLDRWGFECPKCSGWTELDDDPNYQDSVVCDDCGAEFEPDVVS